MSESLATDIERIQTGAHELVEIRLLNAVRSGAVTLRSQDAAEATRLLGAEGTTLHARIGLDPSAAVAEVLAAFADVLGRWQRRAENPLAPGPAVEAARVLVRTCEALAGSLPGGRRSVGRLRKCLIAPGGPPTETRSRRNHQGPVGAGDPQGS